MTKKIWLIGGGTGGHIYPLRNLADELLHQKAEVNLILADQTLDRKIAKDDFSDLKIHFLRTGKIRCYLSLKNISDLFLILKAFFRARKLLKESPPDVLFFKGGFVCFPIILAAKSLRLPAKRFSHESDISSGRFGKWLEKQCHKTFRNFDTKAPYPLFFCPRSQSKGLEKAPIQIPSFPEGIQTFSNLHILIFGGSQGAAFINLSFSSNAETLLEKYKITLLTGSDKKIKLKHKNFTQYETLPAPELAEKIDDADLIISRGGANSLFEILNAQKPSIIIPLPSVARNHQYHNAKHFADQDLCVLLEQNKQTSEQLPKIIQTTLENKKLQQNLKTASIQNAASEIAQILLSA